MASEYLTLQVQSGEHYGENAHIIGTIVPNASQPIPCVLTIAASDSSGAAGAQADLKTFEARQVYGMSALTAITAQNSREIEGVEILSPDFVDRQIKAVLKDINVAAIKTGLLFRQEIIINVAERLMISHVPHLVVDPVLVAGDGRRLLDDHAIRAYQEWLFPRAALITPNLDEAAILTGRSVTDAESMRSAAKTLHEQGSRAVLVKGGHLADGEILDILYDGSDFYEFRAERLPVPNARGTGCTFASCVAAELAKGGSVVEAVGIAKRYVTAALAGAIGWQIGHGRGTLFHSVGRAALY